MEGKYIKISRVIVTLLVFILLNIWFILDRDPHVLLATLVSLVVFLSNSLSIKVCKVLIDKGEKIENKIIRILYYIFALPILALVILFVVALIFVLFLDLLDYIGAFGRDLVFLVTLVGGCGILTFYLYNNKIKVQGGKYGC